MIEMLSAKNQGRGPIFIVFNHHEQLLQYFSVSSPKPEKTSACEWRQAEHEVVLSSGSGNEKRHAMATDNTATWVGSDSECI